ncbi:MAG TPA: DUF4249 domain-containing protein [Chryseolinea sp.]|nr:DUF4249 domain-containing protein [Chryseolinea sp.]
MNKWGLIAKPGFIAILIIGCVEPYLAPDIGENVSIMVVDGFINATESSATVRLTKAVALSKNDGYPAEKGAEVKITSENGDSFTLQEQDSGKYSAYGLIVDASTRYQLNIRTSDNRVYTSDYIKVMQTPPIDSVAWRPEEEGITMVVNTHDDTESSRYYIWNYTETWEYRAPWPSYYTNINKEVVPRKFEDIAQTCYKTEPSTKIILGSTVRLSNDVVRDFPLTYIQSGTSRISVLYSILVRQRVIDRIEYEYLQDLQRVTESVGGLFDSQPYEILGNIRSQDASIPVLGYFSAGFVAEKRRFVPLTDLPDHLQVWPYHYCELDTMCSIPAALRPDLRCVMDIETMPENSYLVGSLAPYFPGYSYTDARCADCRFQGGVLTKPDFWP